MDQASKQDDVHEVKFTHKQKQCDMKPENKKHFNNHRNEKPCDRCGGKHRPGKTNCFAYGKVCGAHTRHEKSFRQTMQKQGKNSSSV